MILANETQMVTHPVQIALVLLCQQRRQTGMLSRQDSVSWGLKLRCKNKVFLQVTRAGENNGLSHCVSYFSTIDKSGGWP